MCCMRRELKPVYQPPAGDAHSSSCSSFRFTSFRIRVSLCTTATLIWHFRMCPSSSLMWRSPATPSHRKSTETSNFWSPPDSEWSKQTSSCSSANHRLLRCRCSLNSEIVKMSSERDNLMAALCLALVQRNEMGRRLRERLRDSLLTNLITATTDHPL